jgi:triosephosphate isomerase
VSEQINVSLFYLPQVVISPSFTLLDRVNAKANKYFAVSAQNCYLKKGAFTGEVNIDQLKDMGIDWVILGHSERRNVFGESDALIAEKAETCLAAGMKILPCIGELEKERVDGKTNEVLSRQLDALFKAIKEWSNGIHSISFFVSFSWFALFFVFLTFLPFPYLSCHCLRTCVGHRHWKDRHSRASAASS